LPAPDYAINVKIGIQSAQFQTGVKNAGRAVNSFGRTMGRVQRAFAAFSALFIARKLIRGIGAAISQFAEFEQGLAKVGILLEDVGRELPQFTKKIEELALAYGISTQKLVKSSFDIQSAVGDTAKSLNILTAATRLAKAGGSELTATTSGLITLMESYGHTLKGTEDAANFLLKTQKFARADIAELASTMGRFLPMAAQLKISQEEVAAVFAQVTRALGNVRESGTAVAAMIQLLLKPTDKLKALSKEWFGTTIQQAVAQEGLVAVLEKLRTVEIESLGVTLGRRRAIKGALSVVNDLATVEEFRLGIIDRENETQDKLNITMNTTQTSLDQLRESWGFLMKDMGEGIAGTGLVEWLKESTSQLREFINLLSFKNLDEIAKLRFRLQEIQKEKAFAASLLPLMQGKFNALLLEEQTIQTKIRTIETQRKIESIKRTKETKKRIEEEQRLTSPQRMGIKIDYEEEAPKPTLFTDEEKLKQFREGYLAEFDFQKATTIEQAASLTTIWADYFPDIIQLNQDATFDWRQSIQAVAVSIRDDLSSAMNQVVWSAETAGEAFKNFGMSVGKTITKIFTDWIASWVAAKIAGLATHGATMAGIMAQQAALSPVLTNNALMMSIITMGQAATIGAAAMGGAIASAQGLSKAAMAAANVAGGVAGMQHGGLVPGVGSGDRVPALLEPGELVIPKKKVESFREPVTIVNNFNGALVMDDPAIVDTLYRNYLKDAIERDNRRFT